MTVTATTSATRQPPARTAAPRVGSAVISRLARLLVRVFFRQIGVEGADRLPDDKPIVLVANHVNGLVDGLVLMAVLPRYPRFLGKATLFKILPLAPFLRLAGVVPVYRAKDTPGVAHRDVTRNDAAFRTSRALLAEQGLVALFPEGISHDEARLQPLRTGAARIALGAAFDDGVDDLATIAVGVIYDDKARFRSRALVRLGRPVGVERWADLHQQDPAAAVRALTDDLALQLAAVVPMYESRQDELAFHRIAAIVGAARGEGDAGGIEVDLATRDDIARALSAASAQDPEAAARVAALRALAERYEADLALLGLTDAEVAAGLSPGTYRRRVGGSVAVAVATAPLAAAGAALHALPYQVMKQVGKRPTNEGMKATVKLFGCFTLFTALYTALGVAAGRRRGPLAGLAAFVAGPLSGYVTVRWAERVQRLGGVTHAGAVLAQRRDRLPDLEAGRADVVTAARRCLALKT